MTTDRNFADQMILWAVTSATPTSELGDCCFLTTPRGLLLQGAGGLRAWPAVGDKREPYLVAVYANESEAVRHAQALIAEAQVKP